MFLAQKIDTPLFIKDRYPFIHNEIEHELFKYVCGTARQLNCPVIKINGVEDHVHILLRLGRTISISELISELKSSSSRWIKTKGDQYRHFSWQGGYGAFSVSSPIINGVIKYISNQKEHHKTLSFKEEFIGMLKRSHIDYEEKFLWD